MSNLQRTNMLSKRSVPYLFLFLLLTVTSCTTIAPLEPFRLFTAQEESAILQTMEDPRRHWITVYASENGPVYANTHRLHPQQVARIPFKDDTHASTPLITIRGRRDEKLLALVDSSSPESWASYRAAIELNLTPLGPPGDKRLASHVKDAVPGLASLASKLYFDKLNMESTIFYTRLAYGPLGALARGITAQQPLCVLGADLLRSFRFAQIDFPAGIVLLSSTTAYQPSPRLLAATTPLLGRSGALATQIHFNGIPKTVILDSAGDFEIAMMDPLPMKLREVLVGNIILHEVSVTDAQTMGIAKMNYPRIGKQLLSKFKVTFDFKSKVVFFERPQ